MGRINLDNLSNELIIYLNNLGLNEEQVQYLIDVWVNEKIGNNEELNTESNDIVGAVNEIKDSVDNLDLSAYQTVEDENLLTENKTIVEAINEVFQSGNNTKQELVAALVTKGLEATTDMSFDELINNIDSLVKPVGTAVAGNVLTGKTFINSTNSTVTGTMANNGSKTVTPKSSNQTLGAGYYSGITVSGNSNLVAANIKKGVSIFGVTGTFEENMRLGNGLYASYIIIDGVVWSAGKGDSGQLGIGSNPYSTTSYTKTNMTNTKCVSGHYYTCVAVTNDGTVWLTGQDFAAGKSYTSFTNLGINNAKYATCSEFAVYVVKNDGTLWVKGRNAEGQLGTGDITTKTEFVQVATNVDTVAAGPIHTVILKTDGTVWVTGGVSSYYNYGQLGLGSTSGVRSFTKTSMTDVKMIATSIGRTSTGGHTLVLKNDGTVWGCGYNYHGQLGNGETKVDTNTSFIQSNITNVRLIDCGSMFSVALKNDGTLWGCGFNSSTFSANVYGSPWGIGSTTDKLVPTYTQSSLTGIQSISCGADFTTVALTNGNVYASGANEYGYLGINSTAREVWAFTSTGKTV